jgi:hypothetical protein
VSKPKALLGCLLERGHFQDPRGTEKLSYQIKADPPQSRWACVVEQQQHGPLRQAGMHRARLDSASSVPTTVHSLAARVCQRPQKCNMASPVRSH